MTAARAAGPGARVGEWVLEERLGGGGFGEVWRARHHLWPERRVAVKLPGGGRAMAHLERAGRLLGRVESPHVLRPLSVDLSADPPYVVLPCVEGGDLGQRLARGGPLPVAEAVEVVRQVLEGLDAAHRAGVVHRDVKPSNVLLGSDGVVRLTDFDLGVSWARDGAALARELENSLDDERTEGLAGTLDYMAPELREGAGPDPRSDLYAVGVLLFECLTGERPKPGDRPGALRAEVPASLDRVFSRLYTRAERRYASAREALDDLAGAPARAVVGPPTDLEAWVVIPGLALEARKYPATNAQYAAYVAAAGAVPPAWWGGPTPPRALEVHPVTGVSSAEAAAWAAWAGGRLPTAEEWRRAADGGETRAYPWGPVFEAGRANTREAGVGTTTPVGAYPSGAAPSGALDMAGNVWEWTSTAAALGSRRVLKGGSFHAPASQARCDASAEQPSEARVRSVGFRVVRDRRR
ncbi:MAG: SUMF1/EgtB/PvdO family nonheme iron enzyme [Planctomycetes bacterium]|nr:SUMF1/EgtB/PvdO family nonheme iron enzyme [Planctomycetota bacterium]